MSPLPPAFPRCVGAVVFVVRSVPARVPLIVFRIQSTLVCLWDPLSGQCLCGTCILRLVQPVEALAGGVQTWMAKPLEAESKLGSAPVAPSEFCSRYNTIQYKVKLYLSKKGLSLIRKCKIRNTPPERNRSGSGMAGSYIRPRF